MEQVHSKKKKKKFTGWENSKTQGNELQGVFEFAELIFFLKVDVSAYLKFIKHNLNSKLMLFICPHSNSLHFKLTWSFILQNIDVELNLSNGPLCSIGGLKHNTTFTKYIY